MAAAAGMGIDEADEDEPASPGATAAHPNVTFEDEDLGSDKP